MKGREYLEELGVLWTILKKILRKYDEMMRISLYQNTLPPDCLAYFPTLKIEAICSSETLINFYYITWRHILKDLPDKF
jgi:hypothetical protein